MIINLNRPRIHASSLLDSTDFDKLIGLDAPHQSNRVACVADACSQGRKPCPAPDACRVPERVLPWTREHWRNVGRGAVAVVLAGAAVVGVVLGVVL